MRALALSLLLVPALVLAKPMPAPRPDEAAKSPLVVVASYEGFEAPKEQVEYFGSVRAHFEVVHALKGKKPRGAIDIAWVFHDGSACIAPAEWRFDPARELPTKGTRLVLFLTPDGPERRTYRGSWGRWPANDHNLALARCLVAGKTGCGEPTWDAAPENAEKP